MSETNDRQLPAVDSDLFEQARGALDALRGQGRRSDGTAAEGNTLALKTGERSIRLWTAPAVASWHRERVAEIQKELGGDASTIKGGLIESYARVELIEAALGQNVFEQGPLTGKGKTRAATSLLLSVIDRKVRLASLIGLSRGSKPVPSIKDYMQGKVDRL